ncbi:hypothetical protein D3C87_1353760 [compost metagenome]
MLDQRLGDLCLRQFLKSAHAVGLQRRIARQQQHGALGHPRRIERRQAIRQTRRRRQKRHADLTCDLGPGIGHVDGGGLMTHMDDADTGIDARVIDRHDLVAGKTENGLHAGIGQRLRD